MLGDIVIAHAWLCRHPRLAPEADGLTAAITTPVGWPRHTIGIILNGATGRIGSHPARRQRAGADPRRRRAAGRRRPHRAAADAGRPQRREARGRRQEAQRRMDHRPRQGAGRSGLHDVLRRRRDPPARGACWKRRSPPASTSIPRSRWRCRSSKGLRAAARHARRAASSTARSRTSSACPACRSSRRLAASGLLRPRRRLPHRIRLVGVRRHRGAVPAAELELPQDGRRRADPRYVSALALRDREHARPDAPRRHARCRRRRRSGSTSRARATTVDVEDTASTLIELESGATGTILSSWATRVRRDDLLTFQIDGTEGLGDRRPAPLLRRTTNAQTPRTAHFSIATDLNIDYRANWHRGDRAAARR